MPARGSTRRPTSILGRLAEVRRPKLLILNKVDLVAKRSAADVWPRPPMTKTQFEATFMVSALTGDGVPDLRRWLAEHVPPGPWLYPADQMSDAPMRQLAAEITREKLFERLHQELPYHSTVETEAWKELRGGDVRIEQTIYVERESQRKIVLGKGGADDQGDRRGCAQGNRRDRRAARCTCSCSSRCARAGAKTPSAIARWGWNSRRSSDRSEARHDRRRPSRNAACNGPMKASCSASSGTARQAPSSN